MAIKTVVKPIGTKEVAKKTVTPKVIESKVDNALNTLVTQLNKKFGENAVRVGVVKDDKGDLKPIQRIKTGSISYDLALGGGIPVGRFTETSGAYSSTKTAQALHIIRNAQKMGFTVGLADVEGTTDIDFRRMFGIDENKLVYCRPDSTEETTQFLLDLQKSKIVQMGVLDSIACMSPNKEQETQMEDTFRMGLPQQLLGEYLRKWQMNNNRLERENLTPFTLLGLNQLREKIGAYGDPEYSPGGRAKSFFATVDVRLKRGDWISEGSGDNKEIVGQVVKIKIEKNKTFKRMQTCEFDFYFAENKGGIKPFHNDRCKEIIMCAVEWGVIERGGAWFTYKDIKCQGLDKLIEVLKNDERLVDEMYEKVMFLATSKGD